MLLKTRTFIVAGLLFSLVCYAPASVQARRKEGKFADRVKTAVAKLGTGEAARVEVKLRDKTTLRGYVGGTDESGFFVVDDRTGVARQIPYPQVRQVKGNNLSTGEKILLGFFIFTIVMTVIAMAVEGA